MTTQHLYDAEYRIVTPLPEQLRCGEPLLLAIALTNRGTIPWVAFGNHPVRLAYHWRTPDGATIVHDGLRSALRDSVPPGTEITVELRVEAPPEPGTYDLALDLLEEGITWFSDRQVPTLNVPVSFTANTAPRACIINGNVVINDAVGNHVVAQLQTLRAAGYDTRILTEFVDERLPLDVRRSIETVRLADLEARPEWLQSAINHFYTADVVIVNYSIYYELVEAIKLVRTSSVIFDYHGVTPPQLWDPHSIGYSDLVRGQQNLGLVRYADQAIAYSRFTADELIATGQIVAGRVHVAPYAVVENAAYAGERDPDLIARYDLAGKRVLLYVGRMARNKRIIDLVEALAIVLEQRRDVVLLLVGENQFGPYREYVAEVQRRAAALGCADNVIWTGQVPDLEPYYQLCDLFVTASIHEGFCFPVVEAMARGKPIVAARAAALPGTLGDAGLLFEPEHPADLADKILRLLPRHEPAAPDQVATPALDRNRTIAFVSPRYGAEILGGAERLVRGWAEQLSRSGYQVEVLTTCTTSMAEWANFYDPGVEQINGVVVRRFLTDRVNAGVFHTILGKAARGERISYSDELELMRNNLQSSALNEYLAAHADEFTCVIFAPYLFGTTYWGMHALPDKAIIIPCLHDEAAAYFSVFREMLERAAGLFFNAQAECDFAVEKLHLANPHRTVTGYGFDPDVPSGDGESFRERYNIAGPMLLYSGRLEYGKNVPLLLDYFVRFKTAHPGPLTLALTGTGDVPIPPRSDIVALGKLPEADMPHAYAAALALCQPSLNESFSIVMMESWLQERPVLVHAQSAVTSSHVTASGGGFVFDDYASFCDALNRWLADPEAALEQGQRGHAYVRQHYAWDVVIERFAHGIARFTAPRSEYARLAQRGIVRALAFTRTRFEDSLLHIVELARGTSSQISSTQRHLLMQQAQVRQPGYTIRSRLPVVGRLIAWARRQATSHLKEPYLDPMIDKQAAFNQDLLQTVLPMLEHSLHEQRRLEREVEVLRERIERQAGEKSCE